MAKQILEHPDNSINLQALMLGNGLIDPITQRLAIPYLLQSLGFYSFNQEEQANLLQKNCKVAYSVNKTESIEECNKIPNYFYQITAHVDMYNLQYYSNSSTQPYEEYLSGNYATNITQLLHVNSSSKEPIYSIHNSDVANALNSVFMDSAVDTFNSILNEYKLPMLLYVGQFDGYDGVRGQIQVLDLFQWDQKDTFMNQPRWIYVTDTFTHAGYFKQVPNFTWAIVSRAGHAAPSDQPENMLKLIGDFIHNDGSDAPQKVMCELMNQCNSHGSCDTTTGTCKCDSGYIGQDCSEQLNFSQEQLVFVSLQPQDWYYFRAKYAKNEHTIIKSKNGVRITVLGLDQDDSHLPSFQYYDIKEEYVLQYTHYVQFQDNKQGDNYDLIGIYNPQFIDTANIEITLEQIFQKGEIQIEKSFWAPPNGGFWIQIIIILFAVVSIIFNIILYKKYLLIQKRSYSLVDLKKSGRIDEISTVFVRDSVLDKRRLVSSDVINEN